MQLDTYHLGKKKLSFFKIVKIVKIGEPNIRVFYTSCYYIFRAGNIVFLNKLINAIFLKNTRQIAQTVFRYATSVRDKNCTGKKSTIYCAPDCNCDIRNTILLLLKTVMIVYFPTTTIKLT